MKTDLRKRLRQRSYGESHRHVRAELAPYVATGDMRCARCGELIEPGAPWDLGHHDHDRRRYSGPEHVACNRTAPHRNSVSREW